VGRLRNLVAKVKALFTNNQPSDAVNEVLKEDSPVLRKLLWLADAPMFIDADQVARFLDAVVRPEFAFGPTTLAITTENAGKLAGKLGLEAKISPNALLKAITSVVPFVNAELKPSVEGTGETSHKKLEGQTIEVRRITSPERQLEQLIVHYLVNHPDRLLIPEPVWEPSWREAAIAGEVPRAIVLLDLPPGTKFIPTAAEFADGRVELLYERLKSTDGRETPPPYPDPYPVEDAAKLLQDRQTYWKWFEKNFNATKATIAVESAAAGRGGIQWIDYRVPADSASATVHVHFAARGKYDTGTFAYYLIKRGFKHGLRIVATLKTEPELNVLAVYEK
jgi:hypothetical protein